MVMMWPCSQITQQKTLKGNCYISNNLNVLGKAVIGNTVNADGYNCSIRCATTVDAAESSLTFCNYKKMRFSLADGMWLMGPNSWFNGGYSIGTPVLGMCFNIGSTGAVRIPYTLKTIENMIKISKLKRLLLLKIDDCVILTGALATTSQLYRYHTTSTAINSSQLITIAHTLSTSTLCTSSIAVIYALLTASKATCWYVV